MPVYYPQTPEEKDAALQWAGSRIPYSDFVLTGEPIVIVRHNQPAAVAVYHDYRDGPGIEMSIAAETPLWATRQAISALLAYPFIQLGTRRVTAVTHQRNKRINRFLKGIGFRKEGTMLDAYEDGHAVVFGMTRRWFMNSRWHYEQEDPERTGST